MTNNNGWTSDDLMSYSPTSNKGLEGLYNNELSEDALPVEREKLLLSYLGNNVDNSVYRNVIDRDGRSASLNFLEELAITQIDGSTN